MPTERPLWVDSGRSAQSWFAKRAIGGRSRLSTHFTTDGRLSNRLCPLGHPLAVRPLPGVRRREQPHPVRHAREPEQKPIALAADRAGGRFDPSRSFSLRSPSASGFRSTMAQASSPVPRAATSSPPCAVVRSFGVKPCPHWRGRGHERIFPKDREFIAADQREGYRRARC